MIRLRTSWSSREVIERGAAAGVGLLNARMYYLRSAPDDEFVLGYAALSERKIQEGVRRLARTVSPWLAVLKTSVRWPARIPIPCSECRRMAS